MIEHMDVYVRIVTIMATCPQSVRTDSWVRIMTPPIVVYNDHFNVTCVVSIPLVLCIVTTQTAVCDDTDS